MSETLAAHPLGVLPLGNQYLAGAPPSIRPRSLGPHLRMLPDALLCRVLSHLDAASLLHLSLSSRFLYLLSRDDDLWRAHVLRTFGSRFAFRTSWRRTHALAARASTPSSTPPSAPPRVVRVAGAYSDVLFHKWRCACGAMRASWVRTESVARVRAADMPVARFREMFEVPRVPVVVQGLMGGWRAPARWAEDAYLEAACGGARMLAGGYGFGMREYLEYARRAEGRCDQPLYLFDAGFGRKAPRLVGDYEVPEYFAEDLFGCLGGERPDYRWLVVGPRNSGSSFHKDPNATSAWNACVVGSKRWVLFPPGSAPPGVHPNADESDVTTPVSVLEWYTNFYEVAREAGAAVGAVECTVRAGEVIFVPAGWWHAVINLEYSVAVTQNYVSAANFASVARWLRERPEQVSGCRDVEHAKRVRETFVEKVLCERPELRRELGGEEDGGGDGEMGGGVGGKRGRGDGDAVPAPVAKRGLWESLRVSSGSSGATGKGDGGAQFSFGIG